MEDDNKVQVCRLCFNLISDKSFCIIKDSIKYMLQVITTELDLDITNSPVMCPECLKSLQEMFNYKTNFFESEEKIDSKIVNVNQEKLNLRDIIDNKRPKRKGTKNNQLCRTCLKETEGNVLIPLDKNVDASVSSVLESCLPELDLNITSDPVLCLTCYKTLQKMKDFKLMCNKNESHIKAYLRKMRSSLPKKINLQSVLKFVSNQGTKSNIPASIEAKIESAECAGVVKNEENSGEDHNELYDSPEYVIVKMEPNGEKIVTQQVKREVKETSGVENRLEFVMVKMESTDTEDGLDHIEQVKSNEVEIKSSQSKRFSSRLKQNKASTKSEPNSITQCSDCDYKSRYKYNLRRHRVRFHKQKNGKKLYQCNKCNFTSKWEMDYTKHMLSHVEPQAFQCSRCPFSSFHYSHFIQHIVSHVDAENMDKYTIKKTRCH